MNTPQKISFGELKIDSDALTKSIQIARIKFLPEENGLKQKLCLEQRLDGANGLSAPMSLRFQDYDQLRIFMNDLFIPAMLYFAVASGKSLDWAAYDLKKAVSYAEKKAGGVL